MRELLTMVNEKRPRLAPNDKRQNRRMISLPQVLQTFPLTFGSLVGRPRGGGGGGEADECGGERGGGLVDEHCFELGWGWFLFAKGRCVCMHGVSRAMGSG